jgi:hypothetical protein
MPETEKYGKSPLRPYEKIPTVTPAPRKSEKKTKGAYGSEQAKGINRTQVPAKTEGLRRAIR